MQEGSRYSPAFILCTLSLVKIVLYFPISIYQHNFFFESLLTISDLHKRVNVKLKRTMNQQQLFPIR